MNPCMKYWCKRPFVPWMTGLFLVCLLLPSVALASPWRMIGYDAGAIGSGNSQMTYGDGLGVMFTNPALLSRMEEQIGAGLILYKPELDITLMDRPAAADVPYTYYDTDVQKYPNNPDRPLPTVELPNQRSNTSVSDVETFLSAGFTYSFGLKGFRLGLLAMLPLRNAISINTYYFDEREQFFTNQLHFSRFGEWSPIINGMLALSYMPVKYISLGMALQVSAATVAVMDIYIPEATVQDYMLVNVDTKMTGTVRPIASVSIEPTDFMALSLVWRNESYMAIDGKGNMTLWKNDTTPDSKTMPEQIAVDFKYALDFEPMEVAGGVGFNYKGLNVQGNVTWNRWSRYRDLQNIHPQDSATYEDNIPSIDGDAFKFSDTISFNLGLSYKYLDYYTVKTGFGFYPTPVPAQIGRTNYVDNDTWCVALGHRFDFPVMGKNFYAELGFQFWMLNERTTYKDPDALKDEVPDDSLHLLGQTDDPFGSTQGLQTNNPGYPGFTQKGWMLVASLSIGYKF